jgi:hypothetical protein
MMKFVILLILFLTSVYEASGALTCNGNTGVTTGGVDLTIAQYIKTSGNVDLYQCDENGLPVMSNNNMIPFQYYGVASKVGATYFAVNVGTEIYVKIGGLQYFTTISSTSIITVRDPTAVDCGSTVVFGDISSTSTDCAYGGKTVLLNTRMSNVAGYVSSIQINIASITASSIISFMVLSGKSGTWQVVTGETYNAAAITTTGLKTFTIPANSLDILPGQTIGVYFPSTVSPLRNSFFTGSSGEIYSFTGKFIATTATSWTAGTNPFSFTFTVTESACSPAAITCGGRTGTTGASISSGFVYVETDAPINFYRCDSTGTAVSVFTNSASGTKRSTSFNVGWVVFAVLAHNNALQMVNGFNYLTVTAGTAILHAQTPYTTDGCGGAITFGTLSTDFSQDADAGYTVMNTWSVSQVSGYVSSISISIQSVTGTAAPTFILMRGSGTSWKKVASFSPTAFSNTGTKTFTPTAQFWIQAGDNIATYFPTGMNPYTYVTDANSGTELNFVGLFTSTTSTTMGLTTNTYTLKYTVVEASCDSCAAYTSGSDSLALTYNSGTTDYSINGVARASLSYTVGAMLTFTVSTGWTSVHPLEICNTTSGICGSSALDVAPGHLSGDGGVDGIYLTGSKIIWQPPNVGTWSYGCTAHTTTIGGTITIGAIVPTACYTQRASCHWTPSTSSCVSGAPSTCADYYTDSTGCSAATSSWKCFMGASSAVCENCAASVTSSACFGNRANCHWSGSACLTPAPATCVEYLTDTTGCNSASPSLNCFVNPSDSTCTSCTAFSGSAASCYSQRSICHWTGSTCVNNAPSVCSEFKTDTTGCNSATASWKCFMNANTGNCDTCLGYSSTSTCYAQRSLCHWNTTTSNCLNPAPTTCMEYNTDATGCAAANTNWACFMSGGVCTTCLQYNSLSSCYTQRGTCHWSTSNSTCVNPAPATCSEYNTDATGCAAAPTSLQCFVDAGLCTNCASFSNDANTCYAHRANCHWNTTGSGSCQAGAPTTCLQYLADTTGCTSNNNLYCFMSGGVCHSCAFLTSSASSCYTQRGLCHWNSAVSACQAQPPANCAEYYTDTVGCAEYGSSGTCTLNALSGGVCANTNCTNIYTAVQCLTNKTSCHIEYPVFNDLSKLYCGIGAATDGCATITNSTICAHTKSLVTSSNCVWDGFLQACFSTLQQASSLLPCSYWQPNVVACLFHNCQVPRGNASQCVPLGTYNSTNDNTLYSSYSSAAAWSLPTMLTPTLLQINVSVPFYGLRALTPFWPIIGLGAFDSSLASMFTSSSLCTSQVFNQTLYGSKAPTAQATTVVNQQAAINDYFINWVQNNNDFNWNLTQSGANNIRDLIGYMAVNNDVPITGIPYYSSGASGANSIVSSVDLSLDALTITYTVTVELTWIVDHCTLYGASFYDAGATQYFSFSLSYVERNSLNIWAPVTIPIQVAISTANGVAILGTGQQYSASVQLAEVFPTKSNCVAPQMALRTTYLINYFTVSDPFIFVGPRKVADIWNNTNSADGTGDLTNCYGDQALSVTNFIPCIFQTCTTAVTMLSHCQDLPKDGSGFLRCSNAPNQTRLREMKGLDINYPLSLDTVHTFFAVPYICPLIRTNDLGCVPANQGGLPDMINSNIILNVFPKTVVTTNPALALDYAILPNPSSSLDTLTSYNHTSQSGSFDNVNPTSVLPLDQGGNVIVQKISGQVLFAIQIHDKGYRGLYSLRMLLGQSNFSIQAVNLQNQLTGAKLYWSDIEAHVSISPRSFIDANCPGVCPPIATCVNWKGCDGFGLPLSYLTQTMPAYAYLFSIGYRISFLTPSGNSNVAIYANIITRVTSGSENQVEMDRQVIQLPYRFVEDQIISPEPPTTSNSATAVKTIYNFSIFILLLLFCLISTLV